jgi:hypothetical protein
MSSPSGLGTLLSVLPARFYSCAHLPCGIAHRPSSFRWSSSQLDSGVFSITVSGKLPPFYTLHYSPPTLIRPFCMLMIPLFLTARARFLVFPLLILAYSNPLPHKPGVTSVRPNCSHIQLRLGSHIWPAFRSGQNGLPKLVNAP